MAMARSTASPGTTAFISNRVRGFFIAMVPWASSISMFFIPRARRYSAITLFEGGKRFSSFPKPHNRVNVPMVIEKYPCVSLSNAAHSLKKCLVRSSAGKAFLPPEALSALMREWVSYKEKILSIVLVSSSIPCVARVRSSVVCAPWKSLISHTVPMAKKRFVVAKVSASHPESATISNKKYITSAFFIAQHG